MENELDELESLFSDYFGRTPSNSQDSVFSEALHTHQDNNISDESDDNDVIDNNVEELLIVRARNFTSENINSESSESSDDNDGDDENDKDSRCIKNFIRNGCGCRLQCHFKFTHEEILRHILDINALSKHEKELSIMTLLNKNDGSSTKRGKKRLRSKTTFRVDGITVCKTTFKLCFDVTNHVIKTLNRHVKKNGVVVRSHGNFGKKPKHSISFDDVMRVVSFLRNVAEDIGIAQPAAPKGNDTLPPIYLPSSTTKLEMHKQYKDSCIELHVRSIQITSFKNIWGMCLPHIRIASPREDVCASYEKLRKAVSTSVTEDETLASTDAFRNHVLMARQERDVYNECVQRSIDSRDDEVPFIHVTFDFSQNVSLPHFSRQPGPLYFLSLRKVQIFGFRLDGVPRQLNFLIDEDQTMGLDGKDTHGPDAVLSMIDWALQNNKAQATSLSIHSDNCPGQNKNQYTVGYFMWRVMTGQNEKIEFNMQVPGHARCLVDSGFAHIKMRYRRHDVETLQQLSDIVNRSSCTNEAVCYPSWPWRRWKPFLAQLFRPLRGIRQYQYFRFQNDMPGIVIAKTHRHAEEESISILKDQLLPVDAAVRPPVIQAAGFSEQRRLYLNRSVAPFVSTENRNYYN